MKNTKSMIHTAVFAALTAACAVITVPSTPPFTMQTFAVFLAIYVLGAKRAFTSTLIYTAIGFCGVPVFSGFSAGFATLFGPTGGFILGFLLMPPMYAVVKRTGTKPSHTVLASAAALAVCYVSGSVWFMNVYGLEFNAAGTLAALQACVLPFILPDFIKAAVAYLISSRIRPIIKL